MTCRVLATFRFAPAPGIKEIEKRLRNRASQAYRARDQEPNRAGQKKPGRWMPGLLSGEHSAAIRTSVPQATD